MSLYIPEPVIKRLPMYYRYLKEMERENRTFISSSELAQLTGITASQVRQDINAFGGGGRQGCGYPVTEMRKYIASLLGMNKVQTMAIVGMGNMGKALACYKPIEQSNFSVVAAFDIKQQNSGARIGTLSVDSINEMEKVLDELRVDIAVLTLPAAVAQVTAERLYRCGVRGFWNFAPCDLQLPQDASVVNVHLDESLELLSYRLSHPERL